MTHRSKASQARWRRRWRRLLYVARITRFSSLMVVAVFLLLGIGQGRDILVSLAEGRATQVFPVFWPLLWSAISAWYFARILLDFQFPDEEPWRDTAGDKWQRHLPRALGTGVFLAVAVQSWLARSAAPESRGRLAMLAIGAALSGVVFYLLVTFRRPLLDTIRPALERGAAAGSKLSALLVRWSRIPDPATELPYRDLGDLRRISPVTFKLVALALAVFGVVVLASAIHPVFVGTLANPTALLFLFSGVWIPIGSALVYWSCHNRAPVLTGVLLLAVVFSFWNDNHAVRSADPGRDPGERPTVTDALLRWRAAQGSATSPVPFVLVATAGGGSRAAYWTATVLGALEDEIPGFHQRLFAISGVSGGSVGAAAFRAVLADHLAAGEGPSPCAAATGGLRGCGQRVIGGNFLGPALASALYPDLLQRFLPLPQAVALPDRAAALERGWERTYREAMGSDRFARSLLELYDAQTRRGDASWPALMLNGTWVQTGRRLVTSNLDIGPAAGKNRAFLTAHDLLRMTGRDLPLSTAADNSARFPIVGPAGTLRRDGAIVGRVVDGGYFENYGAVTAREILDEARWSLTAPIEAIVIQITSDPSLPDDLTAPPPIDTLRFGYELRSPIRTFLATRGARGRLAAAELREAAGEDSFFHFRFCPEESSGEPPLGWMLSEEARRRIDGYLQPEMDRAGCSNRAHLETIGGRLGG